MIDATPQAPSSPVVAVIGGGPAGLAAAEILAEAGLVVTVYDRMPSVARKLLIAGRGGLNLTHSEPMERFLTRYGAAEARLAPAVAAFPPAALRSWCEGLGEPTFIGSSGRVFPRSFKASPLLRAWLARLARLGAVIETRWLWQDWTEAGDLLFATARGGATASPAATLLALGGASWPRLGSDGGWVPILERAGIRVAPLRPANGGFEVSWSEPFRSRFEGAPLKRIALSFRGLTVRGEAVVTGAGIEGGAVYALSGPLRDAIAAEGEAQLLLDLRPDLSEAVLAGRLEAPRRGQSASTFLRKAAGLPPVAVGLLREAGPLPAPAALAARIKATPLRLLAPRPIERAISTAGGIALDEVDETFMLRRRPGTFVRRDARLGGADRRLPPPGRVQHGARRGARDARLAWRAGTLRPLTGAGRRPPCRRCRRGRAPPPRRSRAA